MSTDEALSVLKTYLRTLRMTEPYIDDDGMWVDKHGGYQSDSSPAASIAREWAYELLKEADADGMGGCRLCRS